MRATLFLLAAVAACGCTVRSTTPKPRRPPVAVEVQGLHNVFYLSHRVKSGSGPDSEAAFAALQRHGVKTIISVDGATPDVKLAGKYGMRYVHVPVGYDGIPQEKAERIAKAARDLPGPVYVHCHHGKHRGPAAAVCVQMALDPDFTADDAAAFLKQAGTDPRYTGLVNLPQTFRRPTATELDALPADFPSVAKVADLTRLMVAVDERWEHLNAVKAAGWKAPAAHPDIDPPHEALQLAELYRETARLPEVTKKGDEFVKLMKEAEAAAAELEAALRAKPADAEKAFVRSQAACAACHGRFRDK